MKQLQLCFFNAVFPFGRQIPQALEDKVLKPQVILKQKTMKGEFKRYNRPRQSRSSDLWQYHQAALCCSQHNCSSTSAAQHRPDPFWAHCCLSLLLPSCRHKATAAGFQSDYSVTHLYLISLINNEKMIKMFFGI